VLSYQELAQYFNAKKNVSLRKFSSGSTATPTKSNWSGRVSRDTALEVTFGLKVKVKALKDVDAELNGTRLRAGTLVEATLQDRISFPQRQRARSARFASSAPEHWAVGFN
jgi:hypothetical protein